jgi:hypothetical protein
MVLIIYDYIKVIKESLHHKNKLIEKKMYVYANSSKLKNNAGYIFKNNIYTAFIIII